METRKISVILLLVLGLMVCLVGISPAKKPVGAAFTYSGKLAKNGEPVDDPCDFLCSLWDDPCAVAEVNQVGDELVFDELRVKKGKFRLRLDFGSDPNVFNGEARWLEIGVRAGDLDDPNEYTILEPRVELTAAPYAVNANKISGKKVIKSEHLGDKSVDPNKIADKAVRKEHIEDKAIDPNKIADKAVRKEHIENRAVDPNKIALKAVRKEHLEDGIVDANKLGDLSGYDLETSYNLGPVIRLKNTHTSPDWPVIYLESSGGDGGLSVLMYANGVGTDEPAILGVAEYGVGVRGDSLGSVTQNAIGVYGENTSIGPGNGGTGVYGYSEKGVGVRGVSNGVGEGPGPEDGVGVGVYGESNGPSSWAGWFAGNTCIEGNIKITGGEPGAGKVLVSDKDGLASWQTGGGGDSDWTISGPHMYSGVPGNVGIGTTNPTQKLEVAGHVLITGGFLAIDPTNPLISPMIQLKSDSTFDKQSVISFWNQGASLWMIGSDLSNEDTTNFSIYDSQVGASRLYIKSNGNVGIGTTTPGYKLDVAGNIRCVALTETSDERLKANVTQLTGVLDKIENIRGVSFEWNEMAEAVGAQPGEKQIGVIAQEVEAVFPELVSTPDNGYKSVDYTKLTAVLIEAVKELRADNELLKQRIEALERAMQGNQFLDLKGVAK